MLTVCVRVFCALFSSSSSQYGKYCFFLLTQNHRKIRSPQPSSHPASSALFFLDFATLFSSSSSQYGKYCIFLLTQNHRKIRSPQPSSHPASSALFFLDFARFSVRRHRNTASIASSSLHKIIAKFAVRSLARTPRRRHYFS